MTVQSEDHASQALALLTPEEPGLLPARRTGLASPDTPAHPGSWLLPACPRDHPRWEAMRTLRTELLVRRGTADHADILAVLSPQGGEGRSLLAADLAIATARAGNLTLLVDGDFRRPNQHRLFCTGNAPGLANVLESGAAAPLRPVKGVPGLGLLTAGDTREDPVDLLLRPSFKLLVDAWRARYRFVVIDTPPVGQFADAMVIAHVVGRVLMLGRADHSLCTDLEAMLVRLKSARLDVVGAVISDF